MSLILDALRKSEAERRRGEAPSLYSSAPVPGTRQRPAWLRAAPWLVAAVLLLVAGVVLLTREDGPASRAELGGSAQRDGDASELDLAPAAVDAPAAGVATPTRPDAVPAAAAAAAPTPAPGPTPTVAAPAPTPAPPLTAVPPPPGPMPAAASEGAPIAATDEALPPLAVLEPSSRNALPPLKLSMHVYNSEPARRFAIIDGQRVTEGAQLGAAIVTEIRRDGVVLDVGGRRVLVPRP